MSERDQRLQPVVDRVLAERPELRAQFDRTAAECAEAGLGDSAAEVFLDELARDLVGGYPGTAAAFAALADAYEVAVVADPGLAPVVESVFLVLLPDRGPGSSSPAHSDPVAVLGPTLAALQSARRGWRPEPAHVAFAERLVAAVPGLVPLARENGADDGELLVHPFLADVARRVVADVEAGRDDEARAVVDVLEAEVAREPAVREPVAASFVEGLPYPGESGSGVLDLLGPVLRAELRRQRGFAPG